MGGTVKKIGKTVKRAGLAVATGGLSEWTHGRDAFGLQTGIRAVTGQKDAPNLPGINGGQDPAELLAQTGGAPVLANLAMGVDPEDALAGYFGKNKQDGSWNEFLGTLNQKDLDAIHSVHGQLTTISKNRDLRQQAVDKVIADFPNIAQQAAQDRAKAGGEFDEVTKGAMQQALGDTAAKYAAGGGLSSGAANEAFARVGNENALKKLDYMGDREQFSYNTKLNEMNTRLVEVNALRDFQNTMLGGKMQQGFSAQQANLQRQLQGSMANAEMANQQRLADQQSSNAMLGSLGSLGGTILGASLLGPAGAMAGGSLGGGLFGGGSSPKVRSSSYDSYSGRA